MATPLKTIIINDIERIMVEAGVPRVEIDERLNELHRMCVWDLHGVARKTEEKYSKKS